MTKEIIIVINIGSNIHGAQRMNPADFADDLIVPLQIRRGWHSCFWVNCSDNDWVDCCEIWK